jgi:hypothetical protein
LTPTYCFEPDSNVLRYGSGGGGRDVLLLNNYVSVQGRNLSREVHLMNNRQESVVIHVTEIGAPAANAARPQAPEGSTGPLGGRIVVPVDRLHQVGGQLELSGSAQSDLEGADFTVKAVIGKDGHVLEATMIKGPPSVATPLAKAARKLIFAPFTVLGEPVEVETTVTQADLAAIMGDPPRRGR